MQFFSHAALLAALAVTVVTQILKLNIVPLAFANRHPVPTNIGLSIVAAVVAVWKSNVAQPVAWTDWVLLVATIAVVAAIVYNSLLNKWAALRSMEGTGR